MTEFSEFTEEDLTRNIAKTHDPDKTPTDLPYAECPVCKAILTIVFFDDNYRIPWHYEAIQTCIGPLPGDRWCTAGLLPVGALPP
jgi:hypothetical protein